MAVMFKFGLFLSTYWVLLDLYYQKYSAVLYHPYLIKGLALQVRMQLA